jgi:hypothetical protein
MIEYIGLVSKQVPFVKKTRVFLPSPRFITAGLFKRSLQLLFTILVTQAYSLTNTIRYSDDFYAAQKYFYNEAKSKFPKISSDKIYPEVPIKGNATNEELKKITPLTDFFEARQTFLEEVHKYPEQIYTEIFAFINSHPALSVSSSNKAKFEALEKYFYPIFYAFSPDRHYSFSQEVKVNPVPIVFCLKDLKKNTLSFNVTNTTKKNFSFTINENPIKDYVSLSVKNPIALRSGSSASVKLTINTQKLSHDTVFKTFHVVMSDPAFPKLKLIVPIILLPSKEFLSLPPHFFDITYAYSTFFRHISLQKDKSTWPEDCPKKNCSSEKKYILRTAERLVSEYDFGDLCTIQYNMVTSSDANYNSKNSQLKFTLTETGSIAGMERNCPGPDPGTEIHCPPETPNNGKEIYGSRKINIHAFLPPGKEYALKFSLSYVDLANQPELKRELSWLQEKKLLLTVTDASGKLIAKEVFDKNTLNFSKSNLPAGTYLISIFPITPDKEKLTSSFDLQHLNHGEKSRFDFTLNGTLQINVVSAKK